MSDKMIPIPFPRMLSMLLTEYKETNKFYGVPLFQPMDEVPIGPAAGPHTQLAGNIIAAYAAGATYFELKTVQILEGEDLQIKKPCIYVGHEVFNTEWSTELTVEQARNEYIKAYLLLQVLSREFSLQSVENLTFVMSVGYDLKGIQSNKVDGFINDMKQASNTMEWRTDLCYLKEHLTEFEHITLGDIKQIEERDIISDTITLSTMHGCESSEIEQIATYLLKEKKLNTYIKMNPTLVGKEMVETIFSTKGYSNLTFDDEIFEQDITLDMAEQIIRSCQTIAIQCEKEFGIKLTNTFPVKVTNQELDATQMYLSGPPLYPIAINAANLISKRFHGELAISYSGGADEANIVELLEAGLSCITVSSLLLKPGGYKNLTKLIKKAQGFHKKEKMVEEALELLSKNAINDPKYDNKKPIKFERKLEYSSLCAKCNNCVDVCPNRANVLLETENKKVVLHLDGLCNECGSCACECILGHRPYIEKLTIFEEKEAYEHSVNPGVFYQKGIQRYRENGVEGEKPDDIYQLILTGIQKGRIGYEL